MLNPYLKWVPFRSLSSTFLTRRHFITTPIICFFSFPLISPFSSLDYRMMLLLFFFLLFLRLSPAEHCHPDDIAAILKFKNSFSNPQLLPSWTLDMDCCYIFNCDESNRIVELTITYSDLSGTIPDAVADLTHLRTLRLKKMPFLVGEIPPAIGKMTQLVTLQISWTNISGHVPHFLANLQNLKIFDLSFNKLSGSIPPSLATFPDIIGLDLSRNQLTGPIPESFGHFPGKLPSISLSHNGLSGEIPASLANVNFFRVDISRNNLSGDASMFFGESKSSDSLDISRNNFEFNFSQVRFMAPLVTLDISHNKIYGNIPSQITDAVLLQVLNVSYNRLCGEIPTGWKLRYRPEGFDYSSFFHNRCLCGTPLEPCKT